MTIGWPKGRKKSSEHREKISKSLRGRGRPLEVRQKISEALRGQRPSLETRRKMSESRRGEKNHQWRGGRRYVGGYILIYAPNHPNSDCNGYIREHRLAMARYLGRPLDSKEEVHHINGDIVDNRVENLMLFISGSEHAKFHGQMRKCDVFR